MSIAVERSPGIDLSAFRRRIRLLRAWRLGSLGGAAGALIGVAALIADKAGVWDATPLQLASVIGCGLIIGIVRAATERYSDAQVARSIDRRGMFDDRLSTVFDATTEGGDDFVDAVREDAGYRMSALSPKLLYPVRFQKEHALFCGLGALCVLLYLLFDTLLLLPPAARREAEILKREAAQVREIARPVLAQSKRADATAEDKALARDLHRFSRDLEKGRMSKQEAMIRANQLAEQAQKLQSAKSAALGRSLDKAQTAGARLEQMASQAKLEKSDAAKLASQASDLERQIAAAEKQLADARAGRSHTSAAEQKAMQKRLDDMGKALHRIRLSQQAQEMLSKLASTPEYQQAQELLRKLQEQAEAEDDGEQTPLTPDQMRQMADRLEELAKQLNTDEKLKEYAKALLEAAKNARLGQPGKAAGALLGAFGLGSCQGNGQSAGGLSLGGSKGAGAPSKDTWVGDHGTLNHSDKSSLLNVKFQDRVITSQKGKTGPETYTETMGPAQMGKKSGVPYQEMLPKYEKSAESALAKSKIPARMRTQVRDYFASLH
ncbi:MAG TPA: hypothetical protein VGK19_21560 [Capsulimonadaceae bacterium]|jgi:hypothetical protein